MEAIAIALIPDAIATKNMKANCAARSACAPALCQTGIWEMSFFLLD